MFWVGGRGKGFVFARIGDYNPCARRNGIPKIVFALKSGMRDRIIWHILRVRGSDDEGGIRPNNLSRESVNKAGSFGICCERLVIAEALGVGIPDQGIISCPPEYKRLLRRTGPYSDWH